jgi:VCBS repeat protein
VSERNLLHAAILLLTLGCASGAGRDGSAATPGIATYSVGAGPGSIVVEDLNGDGRRDVIVANSGDETLTLLLGTAGGQLELSASTFPAGKEPMDVEAVDLDNDKDFDLVIANHETSLVSVLLNDGRARFVPAPGSPYDSGAHPHHHGVATGDFDGDGWKDVAVESSGTDEVRVLRGNRQGLSAGVGFPVGTMPYYRLGAADVTGDGRVDILIPGHGDNTVRVLHHDGVALKATDWTISLSGQPWMALGEDLNGDERADIAVVLTNAVAVWLSDSGGFSQAPGSPFPIEAATEVASGDINGDGVADIAVRAWKGSEVTIITGRTFSMQKVSPCERPGGLAVADLDGDGRGELLGACSGENRLVVMTRVSNH